MKALELADQLDRDACDLTNPRETAAELRRLAAVEADCAPYLKEDETPSERIKRALGDADSLMSLYRDVVAERDALKAELETERMRLAACGVVAMSNTKESAEINRKMLPEYWSASCADVASMVDREMALRAELERIKTLEPVALDHIACICDGELRYMSGRCAPVHDCELYAMPEGKAAPALYALWSKT